MEWVETTGQSIEEAQAKALDLLNVDGADAEIEVLEDVKKGLFGRVKSDARVRARIKPKAPAPKDDRRNRRGGGGKGGDRNRNRSKGGNNRGGRGDGGKSGNRDGGNRDGGNRGGNKSKAGAAAGVAAAGAAVAKNKGSGDKQTDAKGKGAPADSTSSDRKTSDSKGRDNSRGGNRNNNRDNERNRQEPNVDEEFSVSEQQDIMNAFVGGVAKVFDSGSTTEVVDLGEDTLEAQVSGDDLGLLVGPSGATLAALEELTRTALQRSAGGRRYHRIHVDVDEYKHRRREALRGFALKVAEQVVDGGEAKSLEAMSAADRKVVHDALTDVEDVTTSSEGDDPRRYVVVSPA